MAGVAGQGNSNPTSLFSNHQVVKFGTPSVYYDSSYGVTYSSLADIDQNAVDGYWAVGTLAVDEPTVGLDLNGNGNSSDAQVPTFVYVFKENAPGNQLVEVNGEYPFP